MNEARTSNSLPYNVHFHTNPSVGGTAALAIASRDRWEGVKVDRVDI